MKRISIIAIASLAAIGMTACTKMHSVSAKTATVAPNPNPGPNPGPEVDPTPQPEVAAKSVANKLNECPQLSGTYCTNEGECIIRHLVTIEPGFVVINELNAGDKAGQGNPDIRVDGITHQYTIAKNEISGQAYCNGGILTRTITAANGSTVEQFASSTDGSTVTVVTEGTGAAADKSGQKLYFKAKN